MDYRRAMWVFGLLTVFAAISDRILFVIFPNYLLDRNFSATEIGLVFSLSSLALLILTTYIGKLSDRVGRKGILSLGLLVQAVSTPLFPFASRLAEFALIRVFRDIGLTMATSVKDALTADVFPRSVRPRMFSRLGSLVPFGRALATIVGFLVVTYLSLEWGFYTAAVFIFLGLLVFAAFFRENRAGRPPAGSHRMNKIKLSLREYSFNFKLLILVWMLVSVNYTISYYPAFFILARELGITEGLLFLLLLAGNVISSIFTYFSGGWIEKHGREKMMAGSLLGFSLLTLSYALAFSVLSFLVIMVGVSVFYYVWRVAFKVTLYDASKGSVRGEQMGFAKMIQGAGDMIGPLIGGFLIDTVSLDAAFYAAGIVGAAGFVLALLLRKQS